ncbi:fibrinogen-like protein A [Pecten maximus]|uniref:fibrinogen-like protein A n=1 Tax=Pecten maximus TaxID=6579 RepID=UPI0014587BAF|nr:fibrinogen-like protein A [Pecten maximus]
MNARNILKMKRNIVCLILLFTFMEDIVLSKRYQFTRITRVAQQNFSMHALGSNTKCDNYLICARSCKQDECRSFSYTELENKCETYTLKLDKGGTATISTSTLYFSKELCSCSDVPSGSPSGVYQIYATAGRPVNFFCDVDTSEGPWTVIQNRINGDTDFYRNWTDYQNGFGDLNGEFWIGNDILHILTKTLNILRVELEAWDGTRGYAQYSKFQVADKNQNYRLALHGFSGNLSFDALNSFNGQAFSTYDRDNDSSSSHCAVKIHGAWWYKKCASSNLNGRYQTDTGDDKSSMSWYLFPYPNRERVPLKKSRLLIR